MPLVSSTQEFTKDKQQTNNSKTMDEKALNELLGPDTNFPFDPANHRDGSNPIKRIGPINKDNL